MSDSLATGLLIVLCAGLFQGSFMAPIKWMRGWAWENYWLIFAITAYLISPWVLALATIPHLFEIYAGATAASLGSVAVFGLAWGIGAVTFGLGVDAIGLALGFAVILGVAATSGTLIPLLVHPPEKFSAPQGVLTAAALGVMLAGVAVCSFAGKWKEKTVGERKNYRRGVLICLASGLLSACGNLGFAFGAAITERAEALGVPAATAPNALWTLLTLPLFLCNAGFALHLLRKNRSTGRYRAATGRNTALAVSMGVMWMAGIGLYGAGARTLGDLGPSLGWAILMSSMVLVANILGIVTGEWDAAPVPARRQLGYGVLLLMVAIGGLGYANHFL